MGKTIYDPSTPFTPSRRYPASQSARTFARLMLLLFALVAAIGIGAAIYGAAHQASKWSDEEALAKIDQYREGDGVNLNRYLEEQGYGAMGSNDEYVYAKGTKRIVISILGNDDFRIGNGEGTTRQFGVDSEVYKCRLCWTRTFGVAREMIVLSHPKCEDVYLPASAMAEVIRLANR